MKFWLARWAGRAWFRQHFGEQFRRLEAHVDRLGPVVIGVSTAHPLGILAPFHWGAGLSSIRFAPFALAIVLGAPVRAFAFSALGATIVDPTHARVPRGLPRAGRGRPAAAGVSGRPPPALGPP